MGNRQWIEARRSSLMDTDVSERSIFCSGLRERWRESLGGVDLVCSKSRYSNGDGLSFKYRSIFMDFRRNAEFVATAEFTEWDAAEIGFIDGDDFLFSCDAISAPDLEMAEFVAANWDGDIEHPLDYGSICMFHRLVIKSDTDAVWKGIAEGIEREFKRSSILVLKPYPLEWEGEVTPDNEDSLVRRQAAMKRYYRRRIGVDTVDGDPGKWMWRPIRGPEPMPGRSADWHENERTMLALYG